MIVGDKTLDGKLIKDLKRCSEKKILLKCDICGHEGQTTYHNYMLAQDKNGHTGKTRCLKCACKQNGIKNIGRIPYNKGKTLPPELKGENSKSWKGGRYIDAHGYVMIYVGGPSNIKTKWDAYKKEHVVVMEKHLQRKINRNENIHHIDGDKQNNKIENLQITTSKEHRDAHVSLQNIGYLLVRKNLLSFDKDKNEYYICEELKTLIEKCQIKE